MEKELEFQGEFHHLMYQYTKSKFYSGFIFSTSLINTVVLIAQTWRVVVVRAGLVITAFLGSLVTLIYDTTNKREALILTHLDVPVRAVTWSLGWYLSALDSIFLSIYLMEVILKLYVWRRLYFSNSYNILNLVLVMFNLLDFILPFIVPSVRRYGGGAPFRCLQIFRLIKTTEELSTLKNSRMLTNIQIILMTILHSFQSIGVTLILIMISMYTFAIIGWGLYGSVDPEHFGTLFRALFTLFRLLTLDDWFEIYEYIKSQGRGHVFFYLLLYILLEYCIFLNLVVAVMVDTFELSLEESNAAANKKSVTDDSDAQSSKTDDSESGSSDSDNVDSNIRHGNKRRVDKYYSHLSEKEREKLKSYFLISASLDYNYMMLHRQQAIVDMLVDICAENDINLSVNKEYL